MTIPCARVVSAVLALVALAAPAAHAGDFSPEYKAQLKRTLEKRQARRLAPPARRPGAIVPWPMPPALVIRPTPEVHREIDNLLWLLRH